MSISFERLEAAPKSPDALTHNRLGVVVIGRNEGQRLDACLRSVGGVSPLVYVDSGSTDDSVEIATRHVAHIVILGPDTPFTAALARNRGAQRLLELDANLEYIQFIDGDCEMHHTWLQAAQVFLDEHSDVAVVCGRRFECFPDKSIYNALCDREWDTPVGEAESSGGDSLIRVQAYLQAGGFANDQIAHEEPEFCIRLRALNWRIWRIDAPMTRHDAAILRLGQFYRRSQRAGLGITQCLQRASVPDHAGRAILRRATIWAIVLPSLLLLSLAVDWRLSAAGLMLYVVQWIRNSLRAWRVDGWGARDAATVAALSLIGKFAEAHGMILYWTRMPRIADKAAPTYK